MLIPLWIYICLHPPRTPTTLPRLPVATFPLLTERVDLYPDLSLPIPALPHGCRCYITVMPYLMTDAFPHTPHVVFPHTGTGSHLAPYHTRVGVALPHLFPPYPLGPRWLLLWVRAFIDCRYVIVHLHCVTLLRSGCRLPYVTPRRTPLRLLPHVTVGSALPVDALDSHGCRVPHTCPFPHVTVTHGPTPAHGYVQDLPVTFTLPHLTHIPVDSPFATPTTHTHHGDLHTVRRLLLVAVIPTLVLLLFVTPTVTFPFTHCPSIPRLTRFTLTHCVPHNTTYGLPRSVTHWFTIPTHPVCDDVTPVVD